MADTVERLDILINNAGRAGPPLRTLSIDGNETTLQTNYLAPFLLTTMLRHLLEGGPRSRIVNVASATHQSATLQLDDLNLARHEYSPTRAYAQSKLALVTYSCALAEQLGAGPCEAVSLHPGVITTRLLDSLFHMRGDSPAYAAANIVHVATTDEQVNGRYYDEQRPAQPNPTASTREHNKHCCVSAPSSLRHKNRVKTSPHWIRATSVWVIHSALYAL